jgi:hypothetical protein
MVPHTLKNRFSDTDACIRDHLCVKISHEGKQKFEDRGLPRQDVPYVQQQH